MAKNRPLAENTLYGLSDWLISHIPKSVKKFARNAKEKFMRFFKTKVDKTYLKTTNLK